MNKVKIVFILGVLKKGGTEKQFLETIARLNRDHFDLRVLAFCCQGKVRADIEALHIPFTCIDYSWMKGRFHLKSYLELYELIREMTRYLQREKPQIVQSYLFWANILGTIAAKCARVPVIITGRRGIVDQSSWKWTNWWLLYLSNLAAAVVITNSQALRQHCLRTERFLPPEKIRVIYNGIDWSQYLNRAQHHRYREQFGIPSGGCIVGIIANLHSYKGHEDFLYAASLVANVHPQTRFLIVGRDEGKLAILQNLVRELRLENLVIFTGERDDIPDIISLLDVQVSASLSEGLPNAILEGMASGKPIVATDVGGTSELVVDGETGFLAPPHNPERLAEAILRLLNDNELRIQMGQAGQQRAQTIFGIDRFIHQMETLYLTLTIVKR